MKSISSYPNLTWSQYFGLIQHFKIPGSPDDDDGNWVFAQNILPAGKGKQTWVCHRRRRRRINKPKKACWCVTCPCLRCLWRDEQNGDDEGNNKSLVRVGDGPLDGAGLVREMIRNFKGYERYTLGVGGLGRLFAGILKSCCKFWREATPTDNYVLPSDDG